MKLHTLFDPTIPHIGMILQIYDPAKMVCIKDIHFIVIAKMRNYLVRDYLIFKRVNKLRCIQGKEYFRVKKKKTS